MEVVLCGVKLDTANVHVSVSYVTRSKDNHYTMHVEISVGILARYTEKRVPLKEMFCRLREHKSGYLLIIGKLSHGKCTMRVHVG